MSFQEIMVYKIPPGGKRSLASSRPIWDQLGFQTIPFSFGSCVVTFDTGPLKIMCHGSLNCYSKYHPDP